MSDSLGRKASRLKWYYNNKDRYRQYQKDIYMKRRIEYLSDKFCAICGENDISKLEIDHIDPSQKSINVTMLWRRSGEVRAKELAKCQVLCVGCHLKKTLEQRGVRTEIHHGTYTSYCKNACRCDACRKAATQYHRERRARNV